MPYGNTFLCPVADLLRYFNLSKRMQTDLCDGYRFRSTDKHNRISNNPFIASSIAARLNTHLDHLGIADGETMHSFHSGCSITLSKLGASIEDIATHVARCSTKSARYYTQTDKSLASPIQPIFLLQVLSLWPPQTYLRPCVSQTSSVLTMTLFISLFEPTTKCFSFLSLLCYLLCYV